MSQIFAFQSHKVRTLSENSEIWFVAQDVCACLGLKWTGHKLDAIPEDWQKLARYANFSRSLRFISEPAVYKLAFRSNKPEADAFTNWVASEVLPSIRKSGRYEAAPRQFPLAPVPAKRPPFPRDIAMCAEFMGCYNAWRRHYDEGEPFRKAVAVSANRVSLHHSDEHVRNAVYALQDLLFNMDMLGSSVYHAHRVALATIG